MNRFYSYFLPTLITVLLLISAAHVAKSDEIYDWSNSAASNNSAPPDGWPENMNYQEVNDSAREGMAVIRRFLDALDGTNTTSGTEPAYTLVSGQSLSSGAAGRVHVWSAHASSTGSVTLNVDSAGAKNVVDEAGTQLGSGDITANGIYMTVETSSNHRIIGVLAGTSVAGPVSSTDNALPKFDGTSGAVIQQTGIIVDDSNNVTGVGTLASGAITSSGSLTGTALVLSGTITGSTTVDIGNADTTLSRASAGDINVEGNLVYRDGGTDVPADDGGTGRSSHTAYAVITGGTTSTGAQQSVSGVGTSGQVLTSNGAAALPTWQDASGSEADVQTFDTSGTWNKPSGFAATSPVFVRMWGGGGGGSDDGAGGGGGYNEGWMLLSQLGSTESVTVGAGGTVTSGGTDGNAGGTSSFDSLSAYGGGGGAANGSGSGGGGGGGQLSAGESVSGALGGSSGEPYISSSDDFSSTYGSGGSSSSGGFGGRWHGGGGAGRSGSSNLAGGDSIYGGGGGGNRSGAGGTSTYGGNGGAGGANGTAPGGGGGHGGSGAAGRVEVYVFPAGS